jgi:general secretion pathway protein F
MKHDELAFFNQQLAVMLREGIPLEGAIRQLSAGLKDPVFRAELQKLEADLAKGMSLKDAFQLRQLPEFYKRMVTMGAQGNDLPGVLQLLADYYHRTNLLWTRFKGLMVYPLIVLVVAALFTGFLAVISRQMMRQMQMVFWRPDHHFMDWYWLIPALLGLLAVAWVVAISSRSLRNYLRWHVPAFRDASLANFASAMSLMLRSGTPLPEALAMAETLESGTAAGDAIARWRAQVTRGEGKPAQWESGNRPFPPLFVWLLRQGGENPASGFANAAALYQSRAQYRVDLLLYGLLPVSVLLLGNIVILETVPVFQTLIRFMNALGDF